MADASAGSTNGGVARPPLTAPQMARVRKLKAVLSKLLDPAFRPSDDTVLDKLYSHLSDTVNAKDEKLRMAELSVYIPWLCLVTKHWSGRLKSSAVRCFVMQLAGLVATSPTGFFALYESEILKSLCSFVSTDDCKGDFSVLHGYAKMMMDISTHQSGIHWIIEAGTWKDMVRLALNMQRLYTCRLGCRFVSSLVLSLEKTDLSLCHTVLDTTFAPLRLSATGGNGGAESILPGSATTPDLPLVPTSDETTPGGRDSMIASLKLGSQVMRALLEARLGPERIAALLDRYQLEDWAWKRLHEENTDTELITCISKFLCTLHTTTISYSTDQGTTGKEVSYQVMRQLTLLALKHLNVVILKHFFTLVLDVCVEYQLLWHDFGGPIVYTEEDKQHDCFYIENNLIITQAMPTFICMKVTRVMESDVMDLFAEKVFSLSCTETQRVCYAYRDCLRETTDRSVEALCLQGILSFSRVTSIVKREQAVMAFQCMMHTLKEFVPDEISDISADCIVARRHSQSLVTRFPSILCALLDGLARYISAFQFNWRDSLETVCVLNFLQGLIVNPHISPMLCSKALQLTRLVIVSFIPPNLALLVDTLQGSSIGDLGKQLFRRLHDIHWEVRDSSLEVLEAISSLADAKFPAFQSLLIDNDLPRVVVSIATGDSEPYVRASGLAALCQMVKIQHIWDSALYNQKILDNVLKMLQHDTEGLVRHQASLLVTAIYKHQTIPGSFLDRIYDIMYHVAIYDLHWEVKLGALEFWSEVIESAVTQEGMIDGAFPQMTFSRTARKIVTLDPPEIRNRLLRILRHLSIIGCLHVLWKTLNDDCDLEVVKKSVAIVKKLMALLDKYELTRRGTTNSLPKEQSPNIIEAVYHKVLSDEGAEAAPQKHNLPSSPLEQETLANTIQQVSSDEVIEQIVNEEDINLLSSKVRELGSTTQRAGGQSANGDSLDLNPRIILPSDEFLNKVTSLSDLDKLATVRSEWVTTTTESLESLIDDILLAVDRGLNSVDCY